MIRQITGVQINIYSSLCNSLFGRYEEYWMADKYGMKTKDKHIYEARSAKYEHIIRNHLLSMGHFDANFMYSQNILGEQANVTQHSIDMSINQSGW